LKYVKIKLNNIIKIQIFITILFVQIQIKLEQWRCWRRRRRLVVPGTKWQKRRHTHTTHLWSHVHDYLAELFIIRRELLVFFGEMSHVLIQGHKLLRLGVRYRLGAPNGWDTTGRHKFSAVVLESPYTRFLSGPPDNSAFIYKSGSKPEWVEGSSMYLSLNRLLYVFWKLKKYIIEFNSIK